MVPCEVRSVADGHRPVFLMPSPWLKLHNGIATMGKMEPTSWGISRDWIAIVYGMLTK